MHANNTRPKNMEGLKWLAPQVDHVVVAEQAALGFGCVVTEIARGIIHTPRTTVLCGETMIYQQPVVAF